MITLKTEMRHQSIFHLNQLHPLGNCPLFLLNGASDQGSQLIPEPTAKCAGAILGGGVKMSDYLPPIALLSTFIKKILLPITGVIDTYGFPFLILSRILILIAPATGISITKGEH